MRFSGLGWPVTVNRLLPNFLEKSEHDKFKGVLLSAITTTALVTALFILIALGFFARGDDLNDSTRVVLLSTCLIAPALVMRILCKNLLSAMQAAKRALTLEEVIPGVVLLATLATTITLAIPISPLRAAAIYGFASLCSAATGFYWFFRLLPSEVKVAKPRTELLIWLKSSTVAMWGQAARLLVNRADIIMLGALSSLEETGLYAVALRLCQLLTIPSAALQTYIAPKISNARARKAWSDSERLLRLSLAFAILSSLPFAIAFSLGRETIIELAFGPSYLGAIVVVVILSSSKVLQAMTNALSSFMLMSEQEKTFSSLTTIAMVINVSVNAMLIPTYGAVGASIGTLLSISFLAGSQLWVCRRGLALVG